MAKQSTTPGETPGADESTAAQPVQMVAITTEQLQTLIAGNQTGGLSASDLKEILASQKEEREETRSVRRSNADHKHISAFSYPEGDLKAPKPKLARETYFNNHRESEDELTPLEIEAFNAITHTCEARGGSWTARVKGNRLLVDVPSQTMDDRMNLPDGLVLILTELAQGVRAVTPADMLAQIAALQKQVAAMQPVTLA